MGHLLSARDISQTENKAESLPKLKRSASITFWYRYTLIHHFILFLSEWVHTGLCSQKAVNNGEYNRDAMSVKDI